MFCCCRFSASFICSYLHGNRRWSREKRGGFRNTRPSEMPWSTASIRAMLKVLNKGIELHPVWILVPYLPLIIYSRLSCSDGLTLLIFLIMCSWSLQSCPYCQPVEEVFRPSPVSTQSSEIFFWVIIHFRKLNVVSLLFWNRFCCSSIMWSALSCACSRIS